MIDSFQDVIEKRVIMAKAQGYIDAVKDMHGASLGVSVHELVEIMATKALAKAEEVTSGKAIVQS